MVGLDGSSTVIADPDRDWCLYTRKKVGQTIWTRQTSLEALVGNQKSVQSCVTRVHETKRVSIVILLMLMYACTAQV